ncbi:MAG: two-component regulator propeller domain-containing protein, partial [Longimicrobiales bacterium]
MTHYARVTRSLLVTTLLLTPAAARGQMIAHKQDPETYAATRGRALSQYALDAWDDRHGLPQNSVQAIAQTTDGYLWLGTQDGIVRFDGVRFTVFGRDASPALRRPYIWALEAARDGGLWIGTEEAGLIYASNGKYTSYTTSNGLPSNWISTIYEAANGQLWIGTRDSGVARMANGLVERIAVPGRSVNSITEDATGAIYVATGKGVTRIDASGRQSAVAPEL